MDGPFGRWLRRIAGAAMVMVAGAAAFDRAAANEPFTTSVPFAFLIDADSETVLFEKAADQLMAPASMAKLMTMAVVFEQIRQGRLRLADEFTVSENAWRRGGAPSGGSTMYAVLNSRVSVENLIRGVIIQSANDGCIVLAEGIAGSEPAFAQMMTRRAREIGLARSVFTNSTGLPDPNQRVTARELARLADHIIRTYPEHYAIYSQPEFTWNRIRQFNRNPILRMGLGGDGLKTGFTSESGFGLVGSAVQNGQRLIVVVNGARSDRERADEARKLLEWGFRSFESRLLFPEGQAVGELGVFGGENGWVPVAARRPVRVLVPRGSTERIAARIVYQGPLRAPVEEGAQIARLRVTRGDTVALEVPLFTTAAVPTGPLHRRAFDAATELMMGLIRSGTQGL